MFAVERQTAAKKKEEQMTEPCFQLKGSNPPICGVHRVVLAQEKVPIDRNAPGLGHITCYVCPVSHAVVQEVKGSHA